MKKKFTYFIPEKPLPEHVVNACNNANPADCPCGGEAQFLTMGGDSLRCECRCTKCKGRTRVYNTPAETCDAWQQANALTGTMVALQITPAQPVHPVIYHSAIAFHGDTQVPACGCGGGVKLLLCAAVNEYSLCACDTCGYETDLHPTPALAIVAWQRKS